MQVQNRQLKQAESDQTERLDGLRSNVEQQLADTRGSVEGKLSKMDSEISTQTVISTQGALYSDLIVAWMTVS